MIYKIQVNKRIRNIQVYDIKVKLGERQNALTKLFLRVINRKKIAQERLS